MIGGLFILAGIFVATAAVIAALAWIEAADAKAELEAVYAARSEATAKGNRTRAAKRREHVEATRQAIAASTRRAA